MQILRTSSPGEIRSKIEIRNRSQSSLLPLQYSGIKELTAAAPTSPSCRRLSLMTESNNNNTSTNVCNVPLVCIIFQRDTPVYVLNLCSCITLFIICASFATTTIKMHLNTNFKTHSRNISSHITNAGTFM